MRTLSVAALFIYELILFSTPVNAAWSEPVLAPGVNSNAADYYPTLTADRSKMYFSSTRDNNEDIYVSTRVNGVWTTPVNLGQPVNSGERDICPSISSDGRTLYFVTYNRQGGFGSYDIWFSNWNDSTQAWNNPINAGPNINSSFMEWSPSISHDGSKLYFAASGPRPGWLYALDLYVSERGPDGWLPAVNLGDSINSYDDDYCPSIAPDDTTLYFSSWGPHEVPCWHGPAVDLFAAYYSNGQWGGVTNLCDPINTEYWERSPFIDASGDTLYFARRRTVLDEFDDIYYSVREPVAIEGDGSGWLPSNLSIDIAPNPFNSSTIIRIISSESTGARITIYDLSGQLIIKHDLPLFAKAASYTWKGTASSGVDLPSGTYFVTVKTDKAEKTSKIIKLK